MTLGWDELLKDEILCSQVESGLAYCNMHSGWGDLINYMNCVS